MIDWNGSDVDTYVGYHDEWKMPYVIIESDGPLWGVSCLQAEYSDLRYLFISGDHDERMFVVFDGDTVEHPILYQRPYPEHAEFDKEASKLGAWVLILQFLVNGEKVRRQWAAPPVASTSDTVLLSSDESPNGICEGWITDD